jgi:hypothetical protein
MIKIDRHVKILFKYNPQLVNMVKEDLTISRYSSFYEEQNKNLYSGGNRYLSQLQNAVNKLFARQDIIDLIAPNWLGLSSDNKDFLSKFQTKFLATRIGIDIKNGVTWDTGYIVNWEDKKRAKYYNALVRDGKIKIKEEGEDTPTDILEQNVVDLIDKGVITEEDLALYAEPVNADNYIKYLYSLFSREVSTLENMSKSSSIQWVIFDPQSAQRQQRIKMQTEMKAMNVYVNFITKAGNTDSYILAFLSNRFDTMDQFLAMSKEQKEEMVYNAAKENPAEFITNSDNVLTSRMAEMNKYVKLGLISRNSHGVYHDASDATLILGNTMDELITYFANPANSPFTSRIVASTAQMISAKTSTIKASNAVREKKERGRPHKQVEEG